MNIQGLLTLSLPGVRASQEDYVLAGRDRGIFAIADGFGGVDPGACAAKTACESVQRFLEKEAGDIEATLPFVIRSDFSLAGNVLFNALIHANRQVNSMNAGKHVHEKGGASVLAALLDGELLALANLGTCSAWLFRSGQACELVVPRSYGRLVDPFAADILAGPEQVPLTGVGLAEFLEPEIIEYKLHSGDWLLLQTDGLSQVMRDEMLGVQRKQLKTTAVIDEINSLIKQKGQSCDDNISLLLSIF